MARKNEHGFKLTFHKASCRWCKVIDGQRIYFGKGTGVSDRASYQSALVNYNQYIAEREADQKRRDDAIAQRQLQRTIAEFVALGTADHDSGLGSGSIDPDYLFGRTSEITDRQAAIKTVLDDPGFRAAILNGIAANTAKANPPAPTDDRFTVRKACDLFIASKRRMLASGEITGGHLKNLLETAKSLTAKIGDKAVDDLKPADFATIRQEFPTSWGPMSVANEVQCIRSLFKFVYDSGLIDRPVKFGPEFKRPSARAVRQARNAKLPKLFTPGEIHTLLTLAKSALRAMILLGINSGLGNTDCSELEERHLNLDKATLDFPRGKNGIQRFCPLWPETVQAIREALAVRPTPTDPAHANRVFITKYGNPWVISTEKKQVDSVSLEFLKIVKAAGLKQAGRRFYALRHIFETIGGETKDQAGVDRVMGHIDSSMAGTYREWDKGTREIRRLSAITDHIRSWALAGWSMPLKSGKPDYSGH